MEQSVKQLRKQGQLDKAYKLAMQNFVEQGDIWTQRDVAWVLYEYIKKSVELKDSDMFFSRLEELSRLELSNDETVLADVITWYYSKWIKANYTNPDAQYESYIGIKRLLEIAQSVPLSRPSDGYSALISAVHKIMKASVYYIELIDQLGLGYFQDKDFKPFKTESGQNILSQVEQVYIQYSKSLLSKIELEKYNSGKINEETVTCANVFIPKLTEIIKFHPDYVYPLYYKAKLLLSLGKNSSVTSLLTPFVKKKSKDFWVWQILGDASINDKKLALSCYSKGLLCSNQDDMIVGLREAAARLMIDNKDYAEAKFEIQKCIDTRLTKWGKIPSSLETITHQEWFTSTESSKNNNAYYLSHCNDAEMIVWDDDMRSILITYVKEDSHIANFITRDNKVGFFRYDKMRNFNPKVGEVYDVVMDAIVAGKPSRISFFKPNNDNFESGFYKNIEGYVERKEGALFAFVNDVYIPADIVSAHNLEDSERITAIAIKSYNKKTNSFSWRITSIL